VAPIAVIFFASPRSFLLFVARLSKGRYDLAGRLFNRDAPFRGKQSLAPFVAGIFLKSCGSTVLMRARVGERFVEQERRRGEREPSCRFSLWERQRNRSHHPPAVLDGLNLPFFCRDRLNLNH
jgi:hypothetical protein